MYNIYICIYTYIYIYIYIYIYLFNIIDVMILLRYHFPPFRPFGIITYIYIYIHIYIYIYLYLYLIFYLFLSVLFSSISSIQKTLGEGFFSFSAKLWKLKNIKVLRLAPLCCYVVQRRLYCIYIYIYISTAAVILLYCSTCANAKVFSVLQQNFEQLNKYQRLSSRTGVYFARRSTRSFTSSTLIFGGKGVESRSACCWSGRSFCKHR